ncbi:MAG: ion transporter [Alphaproteobacteria bacterium]|nr:ion transporter [Alphaproteobacteria bacterium]
MTERTSFLHRVRAVLYRQLGPYRPEHGSLSAANCLIVTVIITSLIFFTLESDPDFIFHDTWLLTLFTHAILWVFAAEFVLRLIAAGHDERYGGLAGHMRYIRDNWALVVVDLLAFLPELAFVLMGLPSPNWLRTLRVIRLLKLVRYMRGITLIFDAVRASSKELFTAVSSAVVLWYLASVVLYMAERTAQPDKFGSIPEAMWWSVVTMATVGYGEVVPETALGKTLASFLMLLALGVVSLPSAILAGSFMHQYRARNEADEADDNDGDED